MANQHDCKATLRATVGWGSSSSCRRCSSSRAVSYPETFDVATSAAAATGGYLVKVTETLPPPLEWPEP